MLAVIIHLIWPIDEYARRGRSWVWFKPPKALTSRPIKMIGIISVLLSVEEKIRIVMGAIFCHVAKIRHKGQLRAAIIGGSQKWQGAMPILRSKASAKPIWNVLEKKEGLKEKSVDESRRMPDPIAWIRKYFSIAGVSWLDLDAARRGRKDKRFSSRPIQIKNQELAEMDNIVPRSRVEINNDEEGNRRGIKLGEELNHSKVRLEVFFTSCLI